MKPFRKYSWFWLIVLTFNLQPSTFNIFAQPTNLPAPARVSLTINTNSQLVALGTNLFTTNITLVRAAGIVAPTNSRTSGYIPIATGDQVGWGVLPPAQPPSANLTNWSTLDTNVLSVGDGIPTLNGSGTNTTLYFNQAIFGTNNFINSSSSGSVISGGAGNLMDNSVTYSVISGGQSNSIDNTTVGAFMAGGAFNSMSIASDYSSILGGYLNHIGFPPTGGYKYDTILGGYSNRIMGAWYSMVGGHKAHALHHGSFVWADYNPALDYFATTETNQFLIRALKGVGINTNNPGTNGLKVAGNIDSTVGFSVNGVPIGGGFGGSGFGYTNSLFTNMVVFHDGGQANITLMDDSVEYAIFTRTNVYFTVPVSLDGQPLNWHKASWSGPTNSISMLNQYTRYATSTDVQITGITFLAAAYAQWTVLRITNSAATDKTLFLPATWTTDDGARSYVLTNARVSILSVGTYGTDMTNAVFRTMY